MSAAQSIRIEIARFPTAFPKGEAYGKPEIIDWHDFSKEISQRREGKKDGPNIVPAKIKREPDGRVRRLKCNVLARTVAVLDCETDKQTGEVPPTVSDVVEAIRRQGWGGVVFTTHNHSPDAPRFRVAVPLSDEIDATFPVPEVVAEALGLAGVLDKSKLSAASLFYLPSCEPGCLAKHETVVIDGEPISAEWLQQRAGALLAAREAEQARQREEALRQAEARRAARAAAGFKPAENLIEVIRDRLDLEGELRRHGYTKHGDRYLFPLSQSGIPGVHILAGHDGVQRVFSHHASDPLAAGNLPTWCTVKAIDVVDLVTILDFGGDRTKALHELAKRFGIGEKPQHNTQEEPAGFSDVPPPGDAESPNSETGGTKINEGAAPKLTLISTAACVDMEPRRYILKEIFAAGDLVLMIGAPGAGKSALAPLIGYAVAQGWKIFGRRVRAGKVLYVPAEDPHGMRGRVRALRANYGDAEGFSLVAGVKDLFNPQGEASHLEALVESEKPDLVVIDTIAAAFPGMRENESDDMGRVIRLARALARGDGDKPGPAVILTHHVPKGDETTPRGHSILAGDADVILRLAKNPESGIVNVTFGKNRNGPSYGVELAFNIESVTIGQDEEGDDLTAPLAVECGASGPSVHLRPTERTAKQFLADLLAEQGKPLPIGQGFPLNLLGIEEAAWRESCDSRRLSTCESKKDRSKVFNRAFKDLRDKGIVAANSGWVWLTRPEGD